MPTNEYHVAVLLGGPSSEREVSLRSGAAVAGALRKLGYRVTELDVGEDIAERLDAARPDVAFIALHGKYGEDGTIQGLLELKRIPYTGSGVLSSALAMDKVHSKRVFEREDAPVAPWKLVRWDAIDAAAEQVRTLGYPVVVKPRAEGSSVGVSLVKSEPELRTALDAAFEWDGDALVEAYIKGREIQIALLDDRVLGSIEVIPSNEFYDYEAKYTAGKTTYVPSPELPAGAYERMAGISQKVTAALGCEGAVRVDFILAADGTPYLLEVNTLPGMTELSLMPKIAASAGIPFEQLVENLVAGARLKL